MVVGWGRRWVADAAGDEGQGPPLHRLRAQAVRSRPASPRLYTRAHLGVVLVALCCFRGVSNGVLELLLETSARVFRRYFGIYLLRGDLDPGRDIGGPNLGNAEPRSPHFCCDELLLVSKCSNCGFITLAGSV